MLKDHRGRYSLQQHYLSVLRDLIKTFCETREFQCLLLWSPGLRACRTGRQPFDIRLQAVRPALQGKTTKQLRPIRDDDDDDVGLHVLGCRVDILADQRGERHFKKRWIQAACGSLMIYEQQAGKSPLLHFIYCPENTVCILPARVVFDIKTQGRVTDILRHYI